MRPSAELPPLQPVCHCLQLAIPASEAFDLFTRSIATWWPFKGHSCSGERAADVEFEERVGGAVEEVTTDGDRHRWGTVTAWDPPHGFAMTWHPAQPEDRATLLTVRFVALETGCELFLEHTGWSARGEQAAQVRDGYQEGWSVVLGHYAAAAAREVK